MVELSGTICKVRVLNTLNPILQLFIQIRYTDNVNIIKEGEDKKLGDKAFLSYQENMTKRV